MNANGAALPQARMNDLVTRELPGEVLVYDLNTHQAHCLNETAALTWKYCDGTHSVAEIAALMTKELKLPVDEAAVWLAVKRLSQAHLLQDEVRPPAGISRRSAMRRIGVGTLLVPAVLTVIAPIPAMARTCVPIGQSCQPDHDCCTLTPDTGCCDGVTCVAKKLSGGSCTKNSDCCNNTCISGKCA
jgi:hypothetical protein